MDETTAQARRFAPSSKAGIRRPVISRILEGDLAQNFVGVVSALVIVAIIANRLYVWFATGAW